MVNVTLPNEPNEILCIYKSIPAISRLRKFRILDVMNKNSINLVACVVPVTKGSAVDHIRSLGK